MRIALIAPEKLPVPPISGGPVEITIHELARRLQAHHDVTVFCPSHPSLPERESSPTLSYRRLPHPSSDGYLEALMQQFVTAGFDLLHIFDRPQYVLSLAPRLAETKIILHLHSDLLTRESNGAQASACLDQISAAVAGSYFLRLQTALRIPRFYPKSRVIYPGVDPSRFAPVWERAPDRERGRQQLRLVGKRVVLYAGGQTSMEGLHILVQALRPLMRQDHDVVLMVVGDSWYSDSSAGSYTRDLAQLAQNFKRQIFFTGSLTLEEMPMIYLLADLLVCPAQWEQLQGMVILEAMASGLPVVASARGVIPELIRHGQTGLLVPKHTDPIGFSRAIEFLLAHPSLAADLRRQGRAVVEQSFGWEQAVGAIERLHADVLVD